ncbi:MAG: discoidin domain-containing protein [Clostridia bacterium]|nr:discoidin domain-containing protein [Clostridia bacterium]
MTKSLSVRLIAILLIAAFISPVCRSVETYAAKLAEPLVDHTFENEALGTEFKKGVVAEYNGRKVLKVSTDNLTELIFDAFSMGEIAISFELAAEPKSFTGTLSIQGGGPSAYLLSFNEDGTVTSYAGKQITKYGKEFKKFTIIYDPAYSLYDVYLNDKCVLKRCYAGALSGKSVTFTYSLVPVLEKADVYIDNVLAYSTWEKTRKGTYYNPNGAPVQKDKTIVLTSKTTIPSETPQKVFMKDYSSLHMRSGVVLSDGEKSLLKNAPYYKNEEFMVPAEAIELLFGEEVELINDNIKIGDGIHMALNSEEMIEGGNKHKIPTAPEMQNGVVYLPLKAITINGFKKNLTYDGTTTHYGMVVIADSAISLPADVNELQKLNDYCFYFRPTKERILEDYENSPNSGAHPRIWATADDFARLRQEVKKNEVKKRWFEALIKYADGLLDKEILKYELRDGYRLMYVSDDCENWMMNLGLAYQLTGDRKYFDCAWRHLEAIAKFPDWNPAHHIDVGIMALGYAIAYDWFYDLLTPEQRQLMEKGAYQNCLWTVNQAVESADTAYGTVLHTNNHNPFVNAGNMAVCMAFMDVYPKECSKIAADIFRMQESFLHCFAPYGSYFEGPHYATIAIDYEVRLMNVVETALGTLYGLDTIQGFNLTGDYLMNLQSDIYSYNFGDGDLALTNASGMFWLYDHYDIKGKKDGLANGKYYIPSEDIISQCLIWYNVENETTGDSGPGVLDVYYDNDEIITMRNTFEPGQVFVGIKTGGYVNAHSHLDSGSFVFDALGKRWAYDIGKEDYNLYSTANYFDVFRIRPESHNLLVINPDSTPGYEPFEWAKVLSYESKDKGVISKIDLSPLQGSRAKSAKRGYFFTDNRRSLVIRDEVSLPKQSDLYWIMIIDSDAEIVDNNTVILTDKEYSSRKLKVEFRSSAPGTIVVEAAKPFPNSPTIPGQNANDGYYRLYYKVNASGNTNITAKLTPMDFAGSSVDEYNVSMDSWKIPDGTLNEIPQLDTLTIGGERYEVNERYVTVYVNDESSQIPQVTATSSKYDVSVTPATSTDEITVVTVTDKNDSSNSVNYSVMFKPMYRMRHFDGYESIPMTNVEASDEPQPENPKQHVLDNDMSTRWSSENRQWLKFDLGEIKEFDTFFISMYLGNQRTSKLTIEVSEDGESYTSLGEFTTSGTTDSWESFELGKQKARYVKVNFFGTSSGTWNSPTEIGLALKNN